MSDLTQRIEEALDEIPDGMEQEIQLEKRMCLRRIHVLAQQNNKSPRLLAMQNETKKQSSSEKPIDGWITLTSLLDMLAFTIRQQESRIKVHTWACIAFQIVDDNHDGFITLNQFYKVFALVEPKIVRHELRKSYERATKHTQELSLYTYCKVAMSILSPALSVGSFSHTVRQLPSHDEIRRSIQTNIYIGNRKNDHPDIADAKHILKTIATQWSSFAKLVVNYIQLLYHTDDEELLGGKRVRKMEHLWSKQHDVKYSVSVNSATSGLLAAILAADIKPDEEIICTPFLSRL